VSARNSEGRPAEQRLDRIQLTHASEENILHNLQQQGICVDKSQIPLLLDIASLISDSDEQILPLSETPTLPTNAFGIIVPGTYYNINVTRACLLISAAILDAVATSGLASASLALSGLAKQGIAKLDTKFGEYCCLVHSAKLQNGQLEVKPEAVHGLIFGHPCPFVELNCRLMETNRCNASVLAIAELFQRLMEKGALHRHGDRWFVAL
jgi:hypothetical protein